MKKILALWKTDIRNRSTNMSICFKWQLKPDNSDLRVIDINDNEEIYIGRSRETLIKDPKVSKQQIHIKTTNGHIFMKRIGPNSSYLDGREMEKDIEYEAKDSSVINLLKGILKYELSTQRDVNVSSDKNIVPVINEEIAWQFKFCGSLLICKCNKSTQSNSVAAFDLDGTIIKTKSGKVFPRDNNDWQFWDSSVKPILKKLSSSKKIIIFTNQASLKFPANVNDFKIKISNILKELNLPITVFIASNHDKYRKPAPGMWEALVSEENIEINKEESFYVGDAAGRVDNWAPKMKKDFSNADRLFARNIGLKFLTPEEFFLKKQPAPYSEPLFDPSKALGVSHPDYKLAEKQEVIVLVGSPGSGKSHFVKNNLKPKGYISICQDVLKTWTKCEKELIFSLNSGKSVVIDSTNPDKEKRSKILAICSERNIQARCFVMMTTHEHCLHNNRYREITHQDHVLVRPEIIFAYRKKFEEPTMTEGFVEIVQVPFVPEFPNTAEKAMYQMFLLESKSK